MEKFTVDTIFDDPLRIRQPATGYRFTIDPIILAAAINPPAHSRILDVGCGCGIIPMALARKRPDLQIYGIEIQRSLADHAQHNVRENKFHNIHIINTDVTTLTLEDIQGRVDILTSNPPYMKRAAGRINPNSEKALARHEISLDLQTLCETAQYLLEPRGSIHIIFPAQRSQELMETLNQNGLTPRSMRPIHSRPEREALRIVVHAQKKYSGECCIKPTLYLNDKSGYPTKEYFNLFNA
ncbi:MAG: methyltransferase [Desulfobacterales bacterium]|nr:methyltransferase [Desulfobacterales bacterium]